MAKWIQKVNASIKKRGTKGSFRKWAGKKEGQKITSSDIARGLKSRSAAIRKKAALAKAFKNMR